MEGRQERTLSPAQDSLNSLYCARAAPNDDHPLPSDEMLRQRIELRRVQDRTEHEWRSVFVLILLVVLVRFLGGRGRVLGGVLRRCVEAGRLHPVVARELAAFANLPLL